MSKDPQQEQEPVPSAHDQASTPITPARAELTTGSGDLAAIPHWDPRSDEVLKDQIRAYDDMRRACPLAQSPYGYVSVFRHADALRVIEDHKTYSNAVSRFPSVPNGMDPPEHTPFRKLIEPYFDDAHNNAFAPICRDIADALVKSAVHGNSVEATSELAQMFALQAQCAWLGWPESLHEPLREWTAKNHAATLSRDQEAQALVAQEFDGYIRELLAERRHLGKNAPQDITTHLLRNDSMGRLLTEDEIVSILRNWTVGELGTIAASVGIIIHFLATRPDVQQSLRDDPSHLPAAIDEILRIDAPLIMNRRITTCDVELNGQRFPAGTRLAVLWASANRDEEVFGDPDAFRLDRDPADNLLYGAGIHVCPGAPLARLELLLITQALLEGTSHIELDDSNIPVKGFYPGSGYASLHVIMSPAA